MSYEPTLQESRRQSSTSINVVNDEKKNTGSSLNKESDLEKEIPAHGADDDFPDGGFRAWLIVFGAMCNTFATFGFLNSWGVFQAYYQSTLLPHSSSSSIAWIGSLQYALIFLPALLVGRLFDLGYFRIVFVSSSALLIAATFLVAECKEYWQFLLCQGLAVGIGCGGIWGPTTAVIAHWFKHRRGLAMGCVSAGSSFGGALLPVAIKNLLDDVGFKWTMRIVGFILVVVVGTANLVMRRRLPPRNVKGGLLNLRAFKNPPFTIYCLSGFVIFLGVYTVLTYVDVSAEKTDIPQSFSLYLVAIANAASILGRYSSGWLCDRFGPINVMVPYTLSTAVLTYAWPFADSKGSLVTVTALYGVSIGAYVSLLTNPMMELGETGDVGRRLGMYMSIIALGSLVGPPISGAISVATGGFAAVGYYAGSVIVFGVGLLLLTKYLVLHKLTGKF